MGCREDYVCLKFSQIKWCNAAEVSLRAALEMKLMYSSHMSVMHASVSYILYVVNKTVPFIHSETNRTCIIHISVAFHGLIFTETSPNHNFKSTAQNLHKVNNIFMT